MGAIEIAAGASPTSPTALTRSLLSLAVGVYRQRYYGGDSYYDQGYNDGGFYDEGFYDDGSYDDGFYGDDFKVKKAGRRK
jgi:hypothetical protein